MLTTIKDFVGGIVTDGDSPDLPTNSSRILNNFDIDKSTQKLVVRQPFYPYEELGAWPGVDGYFPYHVIQYTVGIVEPQHNTMVVLRTRDRVSADPDKWDWWVYDNGPNGGDGNTFEPIYQEKAATHCAPAAVLGKVRLALGNERHYRILYQQKHTNFFRTWDLAATSGFLAGEADIDAFLTGPEGEYIKKGQNTAWSYMEGRLFPFRSGDAYIQTTQNNAFGVGLNAGTYDFILAPVFDEFPEQFGAPVHSTSVYVADGPKKTTQPSNVPYINKGSTYEVKHVDAYFWRPTYGRYPYKANTPKAAFAVVWTQRINSKNYVIEYASDWDDQSRVPPALWASMVNDPSILEAAIVVPTDQTLDPNGPSPIAAKRGEVYMFRRNPPPGMQQYTKAPDTDYKIVEGAQRNGSQITLSDFQNTSLYPESQLYAATGTTNYSVWVTAYFWGRGLTSGGSMGNTTNTHRFEVKYEANIYSAVGINQFTVLPQATTTDVDIRHVYPDGSYVLVETTDRPIPYIVRNDPISNTGEFNTTFLFEGEWVGKINVDTGDRFVDVTPGKSPWLFDGYKVNPNNPLIVELSTTTGAVININVDVPLLGFNPRLRDYALFSRYTPAGMALTGDYTIFKRLGVREDSPYTSTTIWYGVSTVSTNAPTRAISAVQVDATNQESNLGNWSEKYDVDGIGFRPYSHTLDDITRRMVQQIPMRDRMHAIGIDGDEGQELVGRTPVSAGQSQLDVWFKPLIAHAGKGLAVLSAVEFQDRLVWFQRNNLIHGSFGDSRRAADYQFMNTGGIAGTHLQRTIAKSNDAVFFANYDGIFRFDGSKPSDITTSRINDYWRYSISKAQKDVAVAGFNKKTNEYWLYIPDDPDRYARLNDFVDPDYPFIGRVWIWDDNEYPARSWRTYTLDDDYLQDTTIMKTFSPTLFLCDKDDNWIFVNSFATLQNNAYFWPGESYIGTDPHYPISFAMQTQNFGERSTDLVPDMFRLVGEDNPLDYNLEVNIYRDNTTADTETLTLKALNRRQRRLDRRRSSTLRIGISGVYNPLTQVDPVQNQTLYDLLPHTTDKAKAALQEEYMRRRPEIREIHFDVLPNPRRA